METFDIDSSSVNHQKTSEMQAQQRWKDYKTWLIENGCKFPNVEFPVAFGKAGVVGAMAVNDIHVRKAFLFVPFRIIITPQMAKDSELKPMIKSFPGVFDNSVISWDYLLWVFLMNEKRKGPNSFFAPYLKVIDNPEILADWSEDEKAQLQDKFLSVKCEKFQSNIKIHYTKLLPVFQAFPEFFPEKYYLNSNLFEEFYWAYKVVTTRAFCPHEGMLVPLADCLNHEDVTVDYITLTEDFLLARCQGRSLINDYQDFMGKSSSSCNIMKTRTHKNRLEKYLAWFDSEKIQDLEAVWEIDQLLHEFESSTDEEDPIHISTSEETSEEEGDDFDLRFDPRDKYFVVRTKENGSFRAGQQVFNCYGRLNNFDMLLDYGFCLYPNRYDSCYLRLFKCKLILPTARKKRGTKTFNLKLNQVNLRLMKYIRKRISTKDSYENIFSACQAELLILKKFKSLLQEFQENFPTTLNQDELDLSNQSTSSNSPNPRTLFALRYRLSQKEILKSQSDLTKTLKSMLHQILEGKSVREVHWSDRSVSSCKRVYPLRTYLFNLESGELW